MEKKEYIGSLNNEKLKSDREKLCPNLQQIYVVVANGASDTGKGRLAGSIASILGDDTFVIKYDPMIGMFPENVGLIFSEIDEGLMAQIGQTVSDDFKTYLELGINPDAIYNILAGIIKKNFSEFAATRPQIGPGEQKKLTIADRSYFLAEKILNIINKRNSKKLVMEIGGIVEDQEQAHLGATLRFIEMRTGITPQIVGLTYLEATETNPLAIKTQIARNGIRTIMKQYPGLPLHCVMIRRRFLSTKVSIEKIREELMRIAYETAIQPDKLIFMENVPDGNPNKIKELVEKSGKFC